jgi:UDPglucose 6-dehydrogenase
MVTEVSIPGLEVVRSAQEASAGADLIMVMTEWNEFKHLSPAEIRATVSEGKIFDTRRIINRESWKKHFGTVAILGGS